MFTTSRVQVKFSGGDVNALWHCATARAPESPPLTQCPMHCRTNKLRSSAYWRIRFKLIIVTIVNFIVRPLHTKLYLNPRYIVSRHCILFLLSLPTSRKLRFRCCLFVCLSVCLLATLNKTSKRIWMKFSGKVDNGPMKK